MNLHIRIVGKILTRIIELVEDIYCTLVTQYNSIEAFVQICSGTCLVVTRTVAVGNHLDLQRTIAIGFLIYIKINDISCITTYSCRAGKFSEGVAHAAIRIVRHLLEMTVNLVVVTDTEEFLEVTTISVVTCTGLPCIVLYLKNHCLHIGIQRLKVLVLGQCFIGKSLNLVVEFRAGSVFEQFVKSQLISRQFRFKISISINTTAAVLDKLVCEFYLLESPRTAGDIVCIPTHHNTLGITV